MKKVNGIILNKKVQATWVRDLFNKKNEVRLDIGKRYIKGELVKIRSEKLDPKDKNVLFYDLIFDDGTLFRVGGTRVNKLI